jgi:hypothetical protein
MRKFLRRLFSFKPRLIFVNKEAINTLWLQEKVGDSYIVVGVQPTSGVNRVIDNVAFSNVN